MEKYMYNDFAIFICTHGRPDKQLTYKTLKNYGYNGKIYLVLDDTDSTIQQYIDNFGTDNIYVFDKQHYINDTDVGTNNPSFKCIVYAKNAVEDIARDLNLTSFVIADDDIEKFRFRFQNNAKLSSYKLCEFDVCVELCNELLLSADIASLGFSFTQMYFGGCEGLKDLYKFRVPYNFVFRNAKFRVNWQSWFGEDIITALSYNKTGQFWTVIPNIQQDIANVGSGNADGGMADVYRTIDSFRLAMCDFIYHPSAIRPYWYKNKFMAAIKKVNAYPLLISSRYRRDDCE